MFAQKYARMSSLIRSFTTLLLIGLLLLSSSASAQGSGPSRQKAEGIQLGLTPLEDKTLWQADISSALSSSNLTMNLIQDPGFEAYSETTHDDPYWSESDSLWYAPSPLCNIADCGNLYEAHPYNGYAWGSFGFGRAPIHTGTISQIFTIPSCGTGYLKFYFWIGFADTGSDTSDVFYAQIDGNTVFSANAAQKDSYLYYTPVTIDVNSLAKGTTHTIQFTNINTTQMVLFNLDDVYLYWNTCSVISGNTGIGDVTLSYTDGTPKTVTSAGNGDYAITVTSNWSGTVTPSHACYTFSPASWPYFNITTDQFAQNYVPTLVDAANCAAVNIDIGGTSMGHYGILPGGRITPRYHVMNGPVNVASTNATTIFTSERVHNGNGFVNELMGVPNNQLTTEYWFPWYDNVSMSSWILVGNPSTNTDAHVHVYIAGVEQTDSPYTITPGSKITPRYSGALDGPVHIVSDINVFTSERVHTSQGFVNELAGISNNQLSTEYWFPWYDNVSMKSWILVGNPSTDTDAHVHIYIAGVEQTDSPYTIAPGGRITSRHTGVMNGPVYIVSDINIFATERVHNGTGFINELTGISNNQLTTEYWFPWYDNVSMASWVLVGNPSPDTDAHVHIYIGGVEQADSPYTVTPGGRITPRYTGIMNGPVHIVSDINVFTSERAHTAQGFVNELMGLPNSQLTTQYWFPWYDNQSMASWILVGKP